MSRKRIDDLPPLIDLGVNAYFLLSVDRVSYKLHLSLLVSQIAAQLLLPQQLVIDNRFGQLARYIDADHTISADDVSIWYYLDMSDDMQITLPNLALNTTEFVNSHYHMVSIRGNGTLTLSRNGNLINGASADYQVASPNLVIAWIGGSTGWAVRQL